MGQGACINNKLEDPHQGASRRKWRRFL